MAKMVILRSQQEKRPHWKLQKETAPLLPLRKSVQSGAKGRGDKISHFWISMGLANSAQKSLDFQRYRGPPKRNILFLQMPVPTSIGKHPH